MDGGHLSTLTPPDCRGWRSIIWLFIALRGDIVGSDTMKKLFIILPILLVTMLVHGQQTNSTAEIKAKMDAAIKRSSERLDQILRDGQNNQVAPPVAQLPTFTFDTNGLAANPEKIGKLIHTLEGEDAQKKFGKDKAEAAIKALMVFRDGLSTNRYSTNIHEYGQWRLNNNVKASIR